jgi:predicted DNA-binding protein
LTISWFIIYYAYNIKEGYRMPNISIYLNEETLKLIKAKSKSERLPVSTIVRDAIEQYLSVSEAMNARTHLLKILSKKRPFGDWQELHKERTSADAHRG